MHIAFLRAAPVRFRMEIGTVFLTLNASVQKDASELVMLNGGMYVEASIVSLGGDYMTIEVEGARFEARAWRDGDGPWPMHPLEFPDARAWTIYGVVGHTRRFTVIGE